MGSDLWIDFQRADDRGNARGNTQNLRDGLVVELGICSSLETRMGRTCRPSPRPSRSRIASLPSTDQSSSKPGNAA